MANTHRDTSHQKSRRYTIPQMLQLAREGQQSIDLSRFTYDAARAGVVEQLGHCAVSLRRTSANRPRGWSTETASTSEEVIIIQGNTVRLAHPERQPHGPPGEHEAQKDEGFARFLKKHSSPTHNRVTAGGRIVPMEKRETPPKFDLGQLAPASPNLLEPSKQAGLPPRTEYRTNFPNMNGVNIFGADSTHSVNSRAEENPLEHDINASIVVNRDTSQKSTTLSGGVPSQPESFPNPVPIHHQPLQQRGPLPIGPNQYLPQMNACAYPGMMYPDPTWLYSQPVVLPEAELSGPAAYEPETQSMTMSQHCLYHSRMLYGRLEEQLRGIDRRRAQGAHNPELSQQRLTIAQHRDEARTLIKNLEAHVAMEQQLAHLQGSMVFSPPLNVRAPSYVPQRAGPASRTTESTPGTSRPPASWMTTDKTHSGVKRKPIPIMPPPDRSPVSSPKQDMSEVHKQNKLEEGTKKYRPEYPVSQNGEAMSTLQRGKQDERDEEVGTKSKAELGGEADEDVDADQGTVQEVQNWSDTKETSASISNKENVFDASSIRRHQIDKYSRGHSDYHHALQGLSLHQHNTQTKFPSSEGSTGQGFSGPASHDLSSSVNTSVADVVAVDPMSNKGYSSVSVQPVHATFRLPPSLDGAGDGGRRNAKSMLASAGKTRSPRVVQRSTPNGRAWYGPHSREVRQYGQAQSEGNY